MSSVQAKGIIPPSPVAPALSGVQSGRAGQRKAVGRATCGGSVAAFTYGPCGGVTHTITYILRLRTSGSRSRQAGESYAYAYDEVGNRTANTVTLESMMVSCVGYLFHPPGFDLHQCSLRLQDSLRQCPIGYQTPSEGSPVGARRLGEYTLAWSAHQRDRRSTEQPSDRRSFR